VLGAALVVLLLASRFVDLSRLHLGLLSFNDQVGYITTARALAAGDGLRGSLIYPATLHQPADKEVFYLPGHYAVLALTYRLLGYGVWQSLLPSLAAYVIAAVLTYLLAARYFDHATALTAAALFMLFPPSIVYAFSAMSETTRLAATALALGVFVYLPVRWQFLLGPWLAVLAYLFRETGALIVAGMALLLYDQLPRRGWPVVAAFVAYAAVVIGAVHLSGLSAGRPSLLTTYVFDGRFTTMHSDAVAQAAVASPASGDWLRRLPIKGWENALSVVRAARKTPLAFDTSATLALLGAVLLAALGAARWRRSFLGAVAITGAALAGFVLFLYLPIGYGWLRMLHSLTPALAIAVAVWVQRLIQRAAGRSHWAKAALALAALALGAWVSLGAVHDFFRPAAALTSADERRTAWFEQLGHDDRTVLVGPVEFLHYVNQHYPVRWSFVPANGPTFELLAARYAIGSLVVRQDQRPDPALEAAMRRAGLYLEQVATFDGVEFLVYRTQPIANHE
jgi:hypothetical protein